MWNRQPVHGVRVGKHSNDQMYSFYVITPSGWMNEVGCGSRAATHQSEYYRGDIYGHRAVEGLVTPTLEVIE